MNMFCSKCKQNPLPARDLTMFVSQFVYCIISDHTDGTSVQRATNNVDACTQCAYLFFKENKADSLVKSYTSKYASVSAIINK